MLSGISFKQTKCGGKLDADAATPRVTAAEGLEIVDTNHG